MSVSHFCWLESTGIIDVACVVAVVPVHSFIAPADTIMYASKTGISCPDCSIRAQWDSLNVVKFVDAFAIGVVIAGELCSL